MAHQSTCTLRVDEEDVLLQLPSLGIVVTSDHIVALWTACHPTAPLQGQPLALQPHSGSPALILPVRSESLVANETYSVGLAPPPLQVPVPRPQGSPVEETWGTIRRLPLSPSSPMSPLAAPETWLPSSLMIGNPIIIPSPLPRYFFPGILSKISWDEVIDTICAWLNTCDGILLLGVCPDGIIREELVVRACQLDAVLKVAINRMRHFHPPVYVEPFGGGGSGPAGRIVRERVQIVSLPVLGVTAPPGAIPVSTMSTASGGPADAYIVAFLVRTGTKTFIRKPPKGVPRPKAFLRQATETVEMELSSLYERLRQMSVEGMELLTEHPDPNEFKACVEMRHDPIPLHTPLDPEGYRREYKEVKAASSLRRLFDEDILPKALCGLVNHDGGALGVGVRDRGCLAFGIVLDALSRETLVSYVGEVLALELEPPHVVQGTRVVFWPVHVEKNQLARRADHDEILAFRILLPDSEHPSSKRSVLQTRAYRTALDRVHKAMAVDKDRFLGRPVILALAEGVANPLPEGRATAPLLGMSAPRGQGEAIFAEAEPILRGLEAEGLVRVTSVATTDLADPPVRDLFLVFVEVTRDREEGRRGVHLYNPKRTALACEFRGGRVVPLELEALLRRFHPIRRIPPPPVHFTGRSQELDVLSTHLLEHENGAFFPLVAVFGESGVGKTTLMSRLYDVLCKHLSARGIPLGSYVVSCTNMSLVEDAQAHVIRDLLKVDVTPDTDHTAMCAYALRRRFANGPTFLLFDDVPTPRWRRSDFLRLLPKPPLMPAGSLLVVLTSRLPPDLSTEQGTLLLHLRAFETSTGESVSLLRAVAGERAVAISSAQELIQVADLVCGNMPSALEDVGLLVASGHGIRDLLTSRPDRPRIVTCETTTADERCLQATFDMLWHAGVGDTVQRVFLAASLFPGDFSLEALMAVCSGAHIGFGVVQALELLVQRGLVRSTSSHEPSKGNPSVGSFVVHARHRGFLARFWDTELRRAYVTYHLDEAWGLWRLYLSPNFHGVLDDFVALSANLDHAIWLVLELQEYDLLESLMASSGALARLASHPQHQQELYDRLLSHMSRFPVVNDEEKNKEEEKNDQGHHQRQGRKRQIERDRRKRQMTAWQRARSLVLAYWGSSLAEFGNVKAAIERTGEAVCLARDLEPTCTGVEVRTMHTSTLRVDGKVLEANAAVTEAMETAAAILEVEIQDPRDMSAYCTVLEACAAGMGLSTPRELCVSGLGLSTPLVRDPESHGEDENDEDADEVRRSCSLPADIPTERIRLLTAVLAAFTEYGQILEVLGQYAESALVHGEVAAWRSSFLHSTHPMSLIALNNRSCALDGAGNIVDAEIMHRWLVDVEVATLGPEHMLTVASKSNLASVLLRRGQGAVEADALCQEVTAVWSRTMGREHPCTLTARNNQAAALHALGRTNEAEWIYRDVAQLRERVLGTEHSNTLLTRHSLASVLLSLGQYDEAESELQGVVDLQTKILGPDHPYTLLARTSLVEALEKGGKDSAAGRLYKVLLDSYRHTFGSAHPRTIDIFLALSLFHMRLGAFSTAESILNEVISVLEEREEQKQEPLHEKHIRALLCLATIHQRNGNSPRAELVARQALDVIRRGNMPPRHTLVSECIDILREVRRTLP